MNNQKMQFTVEQKGNQFKDCKGKKPSTLLMKLMIRELERNSEASVEKL